MMTANFTLPAVLFKPVRHFLEVKLFSVELFSLLKVEYRMPRGKWYLAMQITIG